MIGRIVIDLQPSLAALPIISGAGSPKDRLLTPQDERRNEANRSRYIRLKNLRILGFGTYHSLMNVGRLAQMVRVLA